MLPLKIKKELMLAGLGQPMKADILEEVAWNEWEPRKNLDLTDIVRINDVSTAEMTENHEQDSRKRKAMGREESRTCRGRQADLQPNLVSNLVGQNSSQQVPEAKVGFWSPSDRRNGGHEQKYVRWRRCGVAEQRRWFQDATVSRSLIISSAEQKKVGRSGERLFINDAFVLFLPKAWS